MDDKIVYESLETLNEYLDKLIPGVEAVVQAFRMQEDSKALSLFTQLLEGLQWTLDVVVLTEPTLWKNGININVEKVQDVLKEINEAFEHQDFVLLPDILEYELLEAFNDWKQGLSRMFAQ